MSVFSFPRINVRGLIQVNVGTANNDDYSSVVFPDGPYKGEPLRLADSIQVQPNVFGMTDDEWVAWVQEPHLFAQSASRTEAQTKAESLVGAEGTEQLTAYLPAEWNYYGDMGLAMLGVKVVGVTPVPGEAPPDVLGATLSFNNRAGETGRSTGMLIDVNPEDVPCSQVIAASLLLEANGQALMLGPPCKGTTRWINFQRNINLNGPNGAAGTFQCTVPISALQGQPILQYLPATGPGGAPLAGVVFRYVMFRALQPVNTFNHPDNDQWIAAMVDLYGKKGLNPDYVEITGTVAPWYAGEMATTPTGRLLQPTGATIPLPAGSNGNGPAFGLAPAVFQVDVEGQRISIDFATTFPDKYQGAPAYDPLATGNNPKWDFGEVRLQVRGEGGASYDFGAIDYADTAAGDAAGWVFDVSLAGLPADVVELARTGTFYLHSDAYGDLLAEAEWLIASDQSCLFAEQGAQGSTTTMFTSEGPTDTQATIRVFRRGVEVGAADCPPITLWEYDTTPNQAPGPLTRQSTTYGPGQPLSAKVEAPGNRLYTFTLPGQPPPSASYKSLNLMLAPQINLRILPNEDYSQYFVDPAQEPPVGNAALTWDVLYAHVFHNYYLLYPAMSERVPLNDESYWNDPVMARTLFQRTQRSWWSRAEYMPRTRDLSASRRRLIQGWCNKVIQGG